MDLWTLSLYICIYFEIPLADNLPYFVVEIELLEITMITELKPLLMSIYSMPIDFYIYIKY